MILRRLPDRHDDSGVVAVFVAILSIVIFVLAAFAIDFGNAYAVKRKLGVAADAASVAAAYQVNTLLVSSVRCSGSSLTPASAQSAATALAITTARTYTQQNDMSGQVTVNDSDVVVTCTSHGLEVQVTLRQTLATIFGGLAGVETITPAATATALIGIPEGVGGLRPIAACVSRVTAAQSAGTGTGFLVFVSKNASSCDTTSPGEFGYVNFADQGTDAFGTAFLSQTPAYYPGISTGGCNANNVNNTDNQTCLGEWLSNGYGGPVYFPNPAVTTNDDTGMGNNTGLSSGVSSDFQGMLGKDISLPVVSGINPTTRRFDVVGLVSGFVCGTNWKGSVSIASGCTGPPTWIPAGTDVKPSQDALLWVKLTNYATSGVYGTRDGCTIGTAGCDFGSRVVVLYK